LLVHVEVDPAARISLRSEIPFTLSCGKGSQISVKRGHLMRQEHSLTGRDSATITK
jgi:hypothetical protein